MILRKLLKNQPLQSVVRAAMTTQLILDQHKDKYKHTCKALGKIQSTYGWMWEGERRVAKILLSKVDNDLTIRKSMVVKNSDILTVPLYGSSLLSHFAKGLQASN